MGKGGRNYIGFGEKRKIDQRKKLGKGKAQKWLGGKLRS